MQILFIYIFDRKGFFLAHGLAGRHFGSYYSDRGQEPTPDIPLVSHTVLTGTKDLPALRPADGGVGEEG